MKKNLNKSLEKYNKLMNKLVGTSIIYWKKGIGSYGLVPKIYIDGKEVNPKKWTHYALVWDNDEKPELFGGKAFIEDLAIFEKKPLTLKEIRKIAKDK